MSIKTQKSLSWLVAFLLLGIAGILCFIIWISAQPVHAQSTSAGRELWNGDAHVKGAFGADTLGATDAIQSGSDIIAATRIIAATLEMAGKQFNSVNPASGDVMKYDSDTGDFRNKPDLSGSGGGGSSTLAGLTDVNTAGAILGDILTFSAGNIWAASTPVPASHTLDGGHSNVSTGAKAAKDLLYWTGLVWSSTPQNLAPHSIDSHGDFGGATRSAKDLLYWTGTVWAATPQNLAPHSHLLDLLNDVSVAGKTNGQYLGWDGATTLWKNKTLPASSGSGGGAFPPIIIAASTSLAAASANYRCDGVSDEIEINAAMAISGGSRTVQLLEGVFYCAAPIQMSTSGLRLLGAGMFQTILKRGYNETDAKGGLIAFGTGALNYCEVNDLEIDGYKTVWTSANNNGIGTLTTGTATTLNYSRFNNVYLLNNGGKGAYFNNGLSYGNQWVNCRAETNTGHGFHIYNQYELLMDKCEAISNTINGFYIDTVSLSRFQNLLTKTNTQTGFYGNGSAAGYCTLADSVFYDDGYHNTLIDGDLWTITGNTFYGPGATYYSIYLDANTSTITANVFYSGVSQIYNYINTGTLITGNYFFGGVASTGYNINSYGGSRLTVSGNYFENSYTTAVYCNQTTLAHVVGNQCYNAKGAFAKFYNNADYSHASDNLIYLYGVTTAGPGIGVYGSDYCTISDNQFYSNVATNTGILVDDYLGGDSLQATVTGNIFDGSYAVGGQVSNLNGTAEIIYQNQLIEKNIGVGKLIISASSGIAAGIGTATPDAALTIQSGTPGGYIPPSGAAIPILHLNGADGVNGIQLSDTYGAGVSVYRGRRAGGTAAKPLALASGDQIFTIQAFGHNGSAYATGKKAEISFNADEAWTSSTHGTRMTFSTAPTGSTSSTAASERMRIDMAGNIGMATATPSVGLELLGTAFASGGWTSPSLSIAKDEIQRVTAGLINSLMDAIENIDSYSWKWKPQPLPKIEDCTPEIYLAEETVPGTTETIQVEKVDQTREQIYADRLREWKTKENNPRKDQRPIGPIVDYLSNPVLEMLRAYSDDGKLKGKADSQIVSTLLTVNSEILKRDRARDQRITDLEKRIIELEAKLK